MRIDEDSTETIVEEFKPLIIREGESCLMCARLHFERPGLPDLDKPLSEVHRELPQVLHDEN